MLFKFRTGTLREVVLDIKEWEKRAEEEGKQLEAREEWLESVESSTEGHRSMEVEGARNRGGAGKENRVPGKVNEIIQIFEVPLIQDRAEEKKEEPCSAEATENRKETEKKVIKREAKQKEKREESQQRSERNSEQKEASSPVKKDSLELLRLLKEKKRRSMKK